MAWYEILLITLFSSNYFLPTNFFSSTIIVIVVHEPAVLIPVIPFLPLQPPGLTFSLSSNLCDIREHHYPPVIYIRLKAIAASALIIFFHRLSSRLICWTYFPIILIYIYILKDRREILLLFILWNVKKYPRSKY